MNPYGVPIFLVPKKYNTWRMCVDYKAINIVIVKYRNLILRLNDMLDELHSSNLFFSNDLKSGYH